MSDTVETLLMQAARERSFAVAEKDYLKRSHHEEFADRYATEALALSRTLKMSRAAEAKLRLQFFVRSFKQAWMAVSRLVPRSSVSPAK